jgi:hypothetical protein
MIIEIDNTKYIYDYNGKLISKKKKMKKFLTTKKKKKLEIDNLEKLFDRLNIDIGISNA